MPKAQHYYVGLAIEWKVPGFHPIENVFHVHLDLIRREGSDNLYVDNNTPKQMLSYKFWTWLESSAPESFMHQYLNKMFDKIHSESSEVKQLALEREILKKKESYSLS